MRLFIQGENIIGVQVIIVEQGKTIREILPKIVELGFPIDHLEIAWIGLENKEDAFHLDHKFEDEEDTRIHIHRNHRVSVTCMFNGQIQTKNFPPSTTIQRVKTWATGKHGFNLSDQDSADHVLQLCKGENRPSENVHIGTLIEHPHHELCLQLVPADRHQG
jgi:hypothetical protein